MSGASDGTQRPLVLVIGGAKRIGRAIVLELARAGCDVILTYRSSGDEAEATVREAVALGAEQSICRTARLDLSKLDGVARFGEEQARALGRLDGLVLSASSYSRSPLSELSAEDLLSAFTVNAAAHALLAASLAPCLARSGRAGGGDGGRGGSIVAMADIHALGEHGLPRSRDFLAYSMSKAALAEMVRTLARELAPNVRVNAVAPGVVAWPEEGYESDEAAQQAYLSRVPLGRAGTPEDAAATVRWLLLEAHYITGEIIRLDGGRNMV